MSDLKYLTITQLFWDTLEKHRNHVRYPEIRAKIAWCVAMKGENRSFSSGGDTVFLARSNKWLAGIWHCKLSTNPDGVMFYTIEGETMNLAMIGSHHDYPHSARKGVSKAEGLGKKVRASVDRGHVSSPGWPRIKWSVPEDICNSHELDEATLDSLVEAETELKLELEEAPIFRRMHGYRLDDADIDTFTSWLAAVDRALEALDHAQARVRALSRGNEAEGMPITCFAAKPR